MSGRVGAADASGRADSPDVSGQSSSGGAPCVGLLFVCLGNICRSPTAEGVMRRLVAERGLQERVRIDSAGTGDWHVGDAPDTRATAAARSRGIALGGAARQVRPSDFEDFDLLLAMDSKNARDLRGLAPNATAAARVRLLREFDERAASDGELDVPDPYYGGEDGFERVLDLVQAACKGLLHSLGLDGDPHSFGAHGHPHSFGADGDPGR